MAKTSMNLEENIAGVLCYLLTWITGIIFYFMEKKNKTVRFHALQSILTFLPLMILTWIFVWIGSPSVGYYGSTNVYGYSVPNYSYNPGIPALIYLSWLIDVIIAILWIVLMIKAYQGEKFKLPIIGDIAEKHA